MFYHTSTFFTILISVLNVATVITACPPGWSELANSFTCYKLITAAQSWQGAKDFCASVLPNSALIIIDNALELTHVTSLAAGQDIWVGDESSSSSGIRQCARGVNGGQTLINTPCKSLLSFVCEADISPNPCRILSPTTPITQLFHVHPALPYKFIQCSLQGDNYVRLCPKGTVWNQLFITCVFPPQRKRRDDKVEPQEPTPYGNEKDYYDQIVENNDSPKPEPKEPQYEPIEDAYD